jgi:hypothetical protein
MVNSELFNDGAQLRRQWDESIIVPFNKRKFWEELIACSFLTRHGRYRKRKIMGVHRHRQQGNPISLLTKIRGDIQTQNKMIS